MNKFKRYKKILFFFLLFCFVFSFGFVFFYDLKKRKSINYLIDKGSVIEFYSPWEWLKYRGIIVSQREPFSLKILNSHLDKTFFDNIKKFKHIESLYIENCNIDKNIDFTSYNNCNLVSLSLFNSHFYNDMLSPWLNNLKDLQNLNLANSKMKKFDFLLGMRSLKKINLSGCMCSGNISNIAELKNLKKLNLSNTGISDEDLNFLKKQNEIVELDISNNPLTDNALLFLKNNSHIEKLNISHTPITNKGLMELFKINRGIYKAKFDIQNTNITDDIDELYRKAIGVGEQRVPGKD